MHWPLVCVCVCVVQHGINCNRTGGASAACKATRVWPVHAPSMMHSHGDDVWHAMIGARGQVTAADKLQLGRQLAASTTEVASNASNKAGANINSRGIGAL